MKISVITDGNYLFYKTFGVISSYGEKNGGDFLASEGDKSLLMKKIMTDFCYSLNLIPGVDKVIFCKDSRSWRKDFKIERSVYKENRTKEEGIDWDSFFKLMDEFGEYLEKNGFHYSKVNGAEGDDLIWYWNKILRDRGENVLILTGDKDMNQLVGQDDRGWTIVWNSNSKNNRIISPKGWKENLETEDEISIFEVTPTISSESNRIKSFLEMSIIEEIDPYEFIFKKILIGDKGDDVPTVYEFINQKGKNTKFTPTKAGKIWESFLDTEWHKSPLESIWNDPDFLGWISGFILRSVGESDTKENREKVKNNYYENAKLVWLNQNTIPEFVISRMESSKDSIWIEGKTPLTNKNIMIENSRWNIAATPKKFDPFDLFNI